MGTGHLNFELFYLAITQNRNNIALVLVKSIVFSNVGLCIYFSQTSSNTVDIRIKEEERRIFLHNTPTSNPDVSFANPFYSINQNYSICL